MWIPLPYECQNCQAKTTVKLHLNASRIDWTCAKCQHQNTGFFDSGNSVGRMLLARSNYEYNSEFDYSMSIIFSATAVECELSKLYRKWSGIDANLSGTDIDEATIEDMLRRHPRITDKIGEVCRILDSRGLDNFANSHDIIRTAIVERFPSLHVGTLAKDFQKTLFWPRNRILHMGYAQYSKEDAARCYSIADLGLYILQEMNNARSDKLKADLAKK